MILHVSTVVGDSRTTMAKHVDYECESFEFDNGFLRMYRVMESRFGPPTIHAFIAIPSMHIEYVVRAMGDDKHSDLYDRVVASAPRFTL